VIAVPGFFCRGNAGSGLRDQKVKAATVGGALRNYPTTRRTGRRPKRFVAGVVEAQLATPASGNVYFPAGWPPSGRLQIPKGAANLLVPGNTSPN